MPLGSPPCEVLICSAASVCTMCVLVGGRVWSGGGRGGRILADHAEVMTKHAPHSAGRLEWLH